MTCGRCLRSTEITNGSTCTASRVELQCSKASSMRPVDVIPAVVERHLATMYSAIKIAGPAKFKVGDLVRVSKYKTVFEKSYTPNWTIEVFKIVKVQRTNPVIYLLEDYRGKSIWSVL